jgi:hypothetical protein
MAKSIRKPYNDRAGYVASLRSGAAAGWVVIYEAADAGLDVGGARYAVCCESHGTLVGCGGLKGARSSMKAPASFCEACEAAHASQAGMVAAQAALQATRQPAQGTDAPKPTRRDWRAEKAAQQAADAAAQRALPAGYTRAEVLAKACWMAGYSDALQGRQSRGSSVHYPNDYARGYDAGSAAAPVAAGSSSEGAR